jgi:hypothetical protein
MRGLYRHRLITAMVVDISKLVNIERPAHCV